MSAYIGLVKRGLYLLLIIFLFFSLTKNFFDYLQNIQFYQSYKENYEKEKKRNISLKTEILKKSNPEEVEKTIRDKLNLLQPGEESIILPNPTPTPTISIPAPLPNWQQWWETFFQK